MQSLHTLIYISYFSACIPLFLILSHFRKLKEPIIALLSILIFVAACSDLISYILIQRHKSSMPVVNIYFIAQFLLLSYIFSLLLSSRKLIYVITALYLIVYLLFILELEHVNNFQSGLRTIEDIVILTYCVLYYRQLMETLPAENIWQYSPFWITTAVFFYFGSNLFLFIMGNDVFKNLPIKNAMTVWGFHNVNNIVKNILVAVGIYYAGKKQEAL
ncbi:MAG TPA: hypothetical protein VFN30_09480 [Chitinophagaceae bacterium]|nr:hypothetical protein [Chitinophagaceae bacterium]